MTVRHEVCAGTCYVCDACPGKQRAMLVRGEGLISFNLRLGEAPKIGPSLETTVPLHDPFQSLAKGKYRVPIQTSTGFRGV